MLHQNTGSRFGDNQYTIQEFEAESVTYVVSKQIGIDSSAYSFGYLANWVGKKKTVDDFENSIKKIADQSSLLIDKIDETYGKVFSNKVTQNKFEERLSAAQEKRTSNKEKVNSKNTTVTKSKM